jgi:hypothetical protein
MLRSVVHPNETSRTKRPLSSLCPISGLRGQVTHARRTQLHKGAAGWIRALLPLDRISCEPLLKQPRTLKLRQALISSMGNWLVLDLETNTAALESLPVLLLKAG